MRQQPLHLGIVDDIPVSHRPRKAKADCQYLPVKRRMCELLRHNSHPRAAQAFTILEANA